MARGCPLAAGAFVRGTASGPGLPGTGTVAVAGEVTLGFSVSNDPYAFPYNVQLRCVDPGQSCFLFGTLHEDGTLELDASQNGAAPVALARTGVATCP